MVYLCLAFEKVAFNFTLGITTVLGLL